MLAEDGDTVDYNLLLKLIPQRPFTRQIDLEQKNKTDKTRLTSFSELGTSLDSQIE